MTGLELIGIVVLAGAKLAVVGAVVWGVVRLARRSATPRDGPPPGSQQ